MFYLAQLTGMIVGLVIGLLITQGQSNPPSILAVWAIGLTGYVVGTVVGVEIEARRL